MVDSRRWRKLNEIEIGQGKVIYWMSRDIRIEDNWALITAWELAQKRNEKLEIIFVKQAKFLDANPRAMAALDDAIEETQTEANKRGINMRIMVGSPEDVFGKLTLEEEIGAIVVDFSPLRIGRLWRKKVAEEILVPVVEVDTHNIIPVWVTSDKQEYGAYTIRPKINRLLPEFLIEFPKEWSAGKRAEQKDFEERINQYSEKRNDPNEEATSRLSKLLHFGQLSAQRLALSIRNVDFLEELIVRKELADNYCLYNSNYDNSRGWPKWARETLKNHENDRREYLYKQSQFENAATHDRLWNSAQLQMVKTGYMHGYMRMYWAKKILEWSNNADEAQATAIYLNNKYELDGRDPNGYAGIAWAIGGVHDRPWSERKIFGKVRFMNEAGCKRKFDVEAYIEKWKQTDVDDVG